MLIGAPSIFGRTLEGIGEICNELGFHTYTKNQIADWLYRKHVGNIDQMTNLSRDIRARLGDEYEIAVSPPLKTWISDDGTKKYLFPIGGGSLVESAYIPDADRATLCLSTQAGCRRACRFCLTGKQGLQDDLTAGEILNQFRSLPERDTLSNIVYMGMGEPLLNYKNVLESIDKLTSESGLGMSHSRITLSTAGIVKMIIRLGDDGVKFNLALSLHAANDEKRNQIMPINQQPARGGVIKAREEIYQRAFAGTARTHNRQYFAPSHLEIDPFQNQLIVIVREINIFKSH